MGPEPAAWQDGHFDVSTEFLPLDQDPTSSTFSWGTSRCSSVHSFVPTKGGFGPVDLEELGDWAYSVSGSEISSEGGQAATQTTAEQLAQELQAQPVQQHEGTEDPGNWQLQVRTQPQAPAQYQPTGTDHKQMMVPSSQHKSDMRTTWVEASRLSAAHARIQDLTHELSMMIHDNQNLEVRAAQADEASVRLHAQLKAQAADVRAATELVQAHAGEMTALLDANAAAQQRMQQLELENSGLHAKLARAEDCLDGMRQKFKQLAEVTRRQAAAHAKQAQQQKYNHAAKPTAWPAGVMTDDIGQPINFGPPLPSIRVPARRYPLDSPEGVKAAGPNLNDRAAPLTELQGTPERLPAQPTSPPAKATYGKQRPQPLRDPCQPASGAMHMHFPSPAAETSHSSLSLSAGRSVLAETTASSASDAQLSARPYATEASLQEHVAQCEKLERRLMELNAEKSALTAEAAKRGNTTGRTLAEKRRSAFVETRLDVVGKELGSLRQQLKQKGMR